MVFCPEFTPSFIPSCIEVDGAPIDSGGVWEGRKGLKSQLLVPMRIMSEDIKDNKIHQFCLYLLMRGQLPFLQKVYLGTLMNYLIIYLFN